MENFSIQAVSLRTGLSAHVLRAWEQRYGAVKPARTPTGRRYYTHEQVKRLELLARARLAGHSIGTIASLQLEELAMLCGNQKVAAPPAIADALAALTSFEPAIVDAIIENSLRSFGRLEFIDGFMFPFIKATAQAVQNGSLRPAHLSFAHARLREVLGIMTAASALSPDAPRVVLSSAAGLEHEPGLLGAAIYAAASGWYPIRFSPGTAVEDLAFVAEQKNAPVIVYSILWSEQVAQAVAEAVLLRRLAPPNTIVLFGGRLEAESVKTLIGAGLERIQNMQMLSDRLAGMLQHKSAHPI